MGLCDVVYPYKHNVGFIDYMIKVLLDMNEVYILVLLMYKINVKACGLMIGFLSMCEVYGVSQVHGTSRLRLGL